MTAEDVVAEGGEGPVTVFFAITVRGYNELREFNWTGLVDGGIFVLGLLVDVLVRVFWSVGMVFVLLRIDEVGIMPEVFLFISKLS